MIERGVVAHARAPARFLVASLLVGVLAAVILIVDGAIPAFFEMHRGAPAALEPHLSAFRWGTYLYAVAWTAQLCGLALLARLLAGTAAEPLAIVGMAATTVATVLGILEAAFAAEVITWAVRETADIGVIPALYTVLDDWYDSIQDVYIALGLVAQAAFGGALVRSRTVASGVGWAVVIWALAWLPVLAMGIPAILFLMPAAIGVALLISDRRAS